VPRSIDQQLFGKAGGKTGRGSASSSNLFNPSMSEKLVPRPAVRRRPSTFGASADLDRQGVGGQYLLARAGPLAGTVRYHCRQPPINVEILERIARRIDFRIWQVAQRFHLTVVWRVARASWSCRRDIGFRGPARPFGGGGERGAENAVLSAQGAANHRGCVRAVGADFQHRRLCVSTPPRWLSLGNMTLRKICPDDASDAVVAWRGRSLSIAQSESRNSNRLRSWARISSKKQMRFQRQWTVRDSRRIRDRVFFVGDGGP